LFFFVWGREKKGKKKREREEERELNRPQHRMTLSLSLSPSLCDSRKWAREENFPLRAIDRSREFARLFDCEGENLDKREREREREKYFVISSFAFFRRSS
jgi:hypothetical protein